MDVVATPGPRRSGVAKLRMTLRDPETAKPVPGFATIHDRLLHLFIIDRSLEYFAHVHPEPAGEGVFEIGHPLPPGVYMLIADFLPLTGPTQTVQRAIVTPGYRGPVFPPPLHLRSDCGDRQDRRRACGCASSRPGSRQGGKAVVRFTLADASTGAPVTDLEPFLGAPGHMLVVNADLTEAIHAHPEERGDTRAVGLLPAAHAGGRRLQAVGPVPAEGRGDHGAVRRLGSRSRNSGESKGLP